MNEKIKSNLIITVSVVIMLIGFIIFAAGEPLPEDPNIQFATWQGITIGLVLIGVGYLIGHKHFKKVFPNDSSNEQKDNSDLSEKFEEEL